MEVFSDGNQMGGKAKNIQIGVFEMQHTTKGGYRSPENVMKL